MKEYLNKTIESVENNLKNLLQKYRLDKKLTIEIIKDWISNDEGDGAMDASNRFQKKWHKYFAKISDLDEFNHILQTFNDVWNYFPHKSLGGKSPDQMVKKALRENPELKKKDSEQKPDMIVGGQKMSWDNYWAMIKEMEELQKPFRRWVDNDILPKYKEFLNKQFKAKTLEKHQMVAEIFFDRAMHIGFINFDEIRKDFIQKEFPRWWQTHVMMSNLSESEVLSSLQKLFAFIAGAFEKDVKKFGF